MKKILLLLVLIVIATSSCKQHKCAAYNEVEIEQTN
jgi:hypothetical protein